jgi:tetratricopeptide (TPR) repeat protein
MKRLLIGLLVLGLLSAGPIAKHNAQAAGDSAMEYFDLGMKSSMAYKKIEYFSKALELNPRLAPAYEKRGMFYYFQGKYDRVIEDFTRFIRLAPEKADAYRYLGIAYLKVENYDKAIANFDGAIQIEPEMAAAFCYRAEAFRLKGETQEAIEDATRAIRLGGDPRIISDAYKTRGKANLEMGQDDLASADLKKSIEMDPRLVFYKYFSSYASLDAMRNAGLVGMIGIGFVLIFGFKLRPPNKEE